MGGATGPEGLAVTRLGARGVDVRMRGTLTRETAVAFERGLAQGLGASRVHAVLLCDLVEVEGFEPGLPMAIFRSLIGQKQRLARVAVAASLPSLMAAARAATYLLPSVAIGTFRSRAEALQFLEEAPRAALPPRRSLGAAAPGEDAPPPRAARVR